MPLASANQIELHYESFGPPSAPAILLIMGLGGQLVRWNVELCEALVARGYRVIRFDNRDVGRSTWCDQLPPPDLRGLLQGRPAAALPYTLDTMADDAVGLLDALQIGRAHLVGASMGGAIAQLIAARYPGRTRSLTSIMSSSGNPELPPPTPAATAALVAPLPLTRDRASLVADAVRRHRVIESPGYPAPQAELEQLYGEEFDRGFHPAGVVRQLGALIAHGDRRKFLQSIACPTTVLHGLDDPLIPFACGEDVARHVAGARLWPVPGMGHDFPRALTGVFVDAILSAAA